MATERELGPELSGSGAATSLSSGGDELMYLMMPVNVVSRACKTCPRLKVMVLDDKGTHGELVDRDLECAHYDDCLNAVDMFQRGEKENEERNGRK